MDWIFCFFFGGLACRNLGGLDSVEMSFCTTTRGNPKNPAMGYRLSKGELKKSLRHNAEIRSDQERLVTTFFASLDFLVVIFSSPIISGTKRIVLKQTRFEFCGYMVIPSFFRMPPRAQKTS